MFGPSEWRVLVKDYVFYVHGVIVHAFFILSVFVSVDSILRKVVDEFS